MSDFSIQTKTFANALTSAGIGSSSLAYYNTEDKKLSTSQLDNDAGFLTESTLGDHTTSAQVSAIVKQHDLTDLKDEQHKYALSADVTSIHNTLSTNIKNMSTSCYVVSSLDIISSYDEGCLSLDLSNINGGTLAIVSSYICKDPNCISRTAFVLKKEEDIKNNHWEALDGNYSVDNVYLTSDLSMDGDYAQIGNFKKSDITISSKGKKLSWLLENMFDKTIYPSKGEDPKWSFTFDSSVNNQTFEVGTTKTPKIKIDYLQGKYNQTWNQTTPTINDGTSLSNVSILSSNGTTTTEITSYAGVNVAGTYSLPNVTITDGLAFKLIANTARYSAGSIPNDSKGNAYATAQRLAGQFSDTPVANTESWTRASQITTKYAINGSYYFFFGTKTSENKFKTIEEDDITKLDLSDIDSRKIRSLAVAVGNETSPKFTSKGIENTKFNTHDKSIQFIVAIPSIYAPESISLYNEKLDYTLKLSAKQTYNIKVGGGTGDEVEYTIFSSTQKDPAASTTYKIVKK